MSLCAVFIDAGYAEAVFNRDNNRFRADYAKLAQIMAGDDKLLRCYYYTCMPYQSSPPTPDEIEMTARKRKFLDALSYQPRFEVRLGKLVRVGENAMGRPIYQQKRVDLMLGLDMALLAAKGKITSAALFTGDSDIIPAVEVLKHEGVVVSLWHGGLDKNSPPSSDLYQLCDERHDITDVLSRIKMAPRFPVLPADSVGPLINPSQSNWVGKETAELAMA